MSDCESAERASLDDRGTEPRTSAALRDHQEAAIVDWLLCSKGVPVTGIELRTAIKDYLIITSTPNLFKKDM